MSLILKRKQHQVQFFVEKLSDSVNLEMMLIPGGTFLMGSPEDEIVGDSPHRHSDEGPQQLVTIPTFCMGKYPVTQAQWRVVAELPPVDRELDPDPSAFTGEMLPVENVSWFEAQEFCARLSNSTPRKYSLPSEAEWEYACRARTTTPFHFGQTITTDLANYDGTDSSDNRWSGSYGRGPKGIYRQQTTPVDTFSPNAFGLHDMHGNVWEWCLDHYHHSYVGTPTDGSAWIDPSVDQNALRTLRGGSWDDDPPYCCSACRFDNFPDYHSYFIGFRVRCLAARTS